MLKRLMNFRTNNCVIAIHGVIRHCDTLSGRDLLERLQLTGFKSHTCRSFYLLSNSCLFNCSSQHLTPDYYQTDDQKDFTEFLKIYNSQLNFKRRCIKKLVVAFKCSSNEASLLIQKEPILFLDEIDNTIEKTKYLLKKDIPLSFMINNLWILRMQLSDVESRLNAMQKWNVEKCYFLEFLPLFKLSYAEFFRMSSQFISDKSTTSYGNRVMFLAKNLNCSITEIVQRLLVHRNLLFKDFEKMKISLETYFEFGVRKEDLVKDILSLHSSESLIRSRLSEALMKGVKPLRPWMVRCPNEIFQRKIKINEIEKSALEPFKSREEYLIHKLNLDPCLLKTVKSRFPTFFNVNILKLKTMLDFLIAAGYSPSQLCVNGHILRHSISTLKERLTELRTMGIETPSLIMLCRSEKEYRKIVDRIMYFKTLKDEERVHSPKLVG